MAKKITSFKLDEEVLELLKKIAASQDRSQAQSLAVLIKAEAKRLKIE